MLFCLSLPIRYMGVIVFGGCASVDDYVRAFFLLISFFTFTYLFLRIDPLCFQAGCRKSRLNLALVFYVYFVL